MLVEALFLLLSSELFVTIVLLFDNKIFTRLLQWGLILVIGTDVNEQDHHEDPYVAFERDNVKAVLLILNSRFKINQIMWCIKIYMMNNHRLFSSIIW